MAQAKNGDQVRVHYDGTFDDGTVFDSSRGREPLQFTIGGGQLIPGFEEAVIGMEPGQKKTEHVSSENGYGEHEEALVISVDRRTMPADLEPEVGQVLSMSLPDGSTAAVVVAEVSDDTVTLDANHPLAGRDLVFDIELLEIL